MSSGSFYTQVNFSGDPNVGLYGFATDRYCVVGSGQGEKRMHDALKVPVLHLSLMRMDLIRLFITGNSTRAVVPDFLFKAEVDKAKETLGKHDVELLEIESEKALGNLILANDNGVLLSPLVRELKDKIARFFGLPCEVATISKLNIIGSLAIATNKGCLAHPGVTDKEIKVIEKILGVPVDIGTAGFGSPYPGAGVIANSRGFVTALNTSGPELGRIAEALGFVEDR